jgi:hypothetical protein
MSLPHLLKMPDPQGKPYLSLRQDVKARTAPWIARDGLRVGLVWAGGRAHQGDHLRSLHFLQLAPILSVPGVSFHVLQKGEVLGQLAYAGEGQKLHRTDQQIADMADLAGVISHLDLLITVDSMPAHVAGALGIPVWTLLPFTPDYRWELTGSTTDWYDSMRLFRQSTFGNWAGVVDEVAAALCTEVAKQHREAVSSRAIERVVVIGKRPERVGDLKVDAANLREVLERDDRHIGAMIALSQLYLDHDMPFLALFWAGEAAHFAYCNVAVWDALAAAMAALGLPEAALFANRANALKAEGAATSWFGW